MVKVTEATLAHVATDNDRKPRPLPVLDQTGGAVQGTAGVRKDQHMQVVTPSELPPSALLHQQRAAGAFVDCYATEVPMPVAVAELIEAFYTTRIFKRERLLIRLFASKRSTDQEAGEVASGRRDEFAVWRVEQRLDDQVLLADHTGRTRSWLMVGEAISSPSSTRLYFGSAMIPRIDRKSGERRFGLLFGLLLGLHATYSKALLRAAAVKLQQRSGKS